MELSLHLRRKGQEDAWKFVMSTDVGRRTWMPSAPMRVP